jgi:hypothetical protein
VASFLLSRFPQHDSDFLKIFQQICNGAELTTVLQLYIRFFLLPNLIKVKEVDLLAEFFPPLLFSEFLKTLEPSSVMKMMVPLI